MSTPRIEQLLKESLQDLIPVPRLAITDIKEDALSKRLRKFDNDKIKVPLGSQSGVYINTNESGVNRTARELEEKPLILKAFHIGFSGWHNFDIMAQRHSDRALICDFNPENALFLHQVLLLVRTCDNRFQFIEQMTQFIKDHRYSGSRTNKNRESWHDKVEPTSIQFCFNVSDEPPYSDNYSVINEVKLELQRKTSWLCTDERYMHIRKLALMDRVALITENICEFPTFSNVIQLLMDNSAQIDTVYVSNIPEWLYSDEDRDSLYKTIQLLLADQETILIDGRHPSPDSTSPAQRLITARQLKQSTLKNWFYESAQEDAINDVTVTDEILVETIIHLSI